MQPGLRSHFGTISGQILGGLGLQKRGYRVRGVAKITCSPSLDFGQLRAPFWRSLWLQKWYQIANVAHFWGPGVQNGGPKRRYVFWSFPRSAEVQVLAFVSKSSVCTGACAGACVPPSVFENHARARAGTTLEPLWVSFETILAAFWIILHPLGTILGPLGTIFETPFPRFGNSHDF